MRSFGETFAMRGARRDGFGVLAATASVALLTLASADLLAGVNPDGSYSYSIPIVVPNGAGGVAPKLSLTYNSSSGNGLAGVGWTLSGLPVISRMNYGEGIRYDNLDTFSGPAGRLVDVSGNRTLYHSETEDWGKYVPSGTCGLDPCTWTLYDNGGNILTFGGTDESRVNRILGNGELSTSIRIWALSKFADANGNAYEVSWLQDFSGTAPTGHYYPTLITYTTGNGQTKFRTIELQYEARPAGESNRIGYEQRSKVRVKSRLKWIIVRSDGLLVRKYRLDYDPAPPSRLVAVQEYGSNGTSTLPALTIAPRPEQGIAIQYGTDSYARSQVFTAGLGQNVDEDNYPTLQPADVNGDGKPDLCMRRDDYGVSCALNTGHGFYYDVSSSGTFPNSGIFSNALGTGVDWDNYPTIRYVDINSDGRADVCMRRDDLGVSCATSGSSGFSYTTTAGTYGNTGLFSNALGTGADQDNFSTIQFPDVNGDGRPDVCMRRDDYGISCAINTGTGFSYTTTLGSYGYSNLFSNRLGTGADEDNYATIQYPDVNSDGRADVCMRRDDYGISCAINTGTGFSYTTTLGSYGQTGLFSNALGTGADADNWSTIQYPDVNGDGLADVCMRRDDFGISCALSNGSNFVSYTASGSFGNSGVFSNTLGTGADVDNYSTIRFADINGDGMADVCMRRDDFGISCAVSTGSGFSYSNLATGTYALSGVFSNAIGAVNLDEGNYRTVQFVDVDGDGMADVCMRHDSYGFSCARKLRSETDRLSIGNGVGGTTTVDFSPATLVLGAIQTVSTCGDATGAGYGMPCGVPDISPRPLVTKVTSTDGRGALYEVTYSYTNGRFAPGAVQDTANLGFESVTEQSVTDRKVTRYRQAKPFQGQLLSETTILQQNGITTSVTSYGTPGQFWCNESACGAAGGPLTHSRQLRPGSITTHFYKKNTGSGLFYVVKAASDYDTFGNPQRKSEVSYNYSGAVLSTAYTRSLYINQLPVTPAAGRAVGLAYDTSLCIDSLCSNVVARTRTYYDDLPLRSAGTRLRATASETWKGGTTFGRLTRTYDAFGNVHTETGPNGLTVTFEYAGPFHEDKTAVITASLDRAAASYDARWNVPLTKTDANGLTVTTRYDAFGRPDQALTTHPSSSATLTKKTYRYGIGDPAADETWEESCNRYDSDRNPATGIDFAGKVCATTYRDGLGRVYRTTHTGAAGLVEVNTLFDAKGRPYATSEPSYTTACRSLPAAAGCYFTTQSFDAASRITATTYPNGTVSRLTYDDAPLVPGAVTVESIEDGRGVVTRRFINEKGLVVQLTEDVFGEAAVTLYDYDLAGRLESVTSPTGVVGLYYDAAGRKERIVDPDAGTTTYTYYDDNPGQPSYGELRTLVQPAPNATSGTVTRTFYYDAYGRPERETSTDGSVATFAYGEVDMTNGRGRITTESYSADGLTITKRFAYGPLGEAAETYETVTGVADGQSLSYSVAFESTVDEMGRGKTMTYPDGTVATRGYDDASNLASIALGGVTYASFSGHDARGKIGRVTLMATQVATNYTYEPATGLLDTLTTSSVANPVPFLNHQYDFDPIGNVDRIVDATAGAHTTTYTYDGLNRLRRAARGDQSQFVYDFDRSGNLTNKATFTAQGAIVQRIQTFAPGTHRITSDGAGNTISCGARGNMRSKGPWSYEYSDRNMLRVAKKNGAVVERNYYDRGGSRVLKIYYQADGTRYRTYHMGAAFEIREKVGAGGTVLASQTTKYLMGPDGGRFASVTTGQSLSAFAGSMYSPNQLTYAHMHSWRSLSGIAGKLWYGTLGILGSRHLPGLGALAALLVLAALWMRYVLGLTLTRMRVWARQLAHIGTERRRGLPLTPCSAPERTLFVRLHPFLAHVALSIAFVFGIVACAPEGMPSTQLLPNGLLFGNQAALLSSDTSMGLPLGTYFYHGDHLGSASAVTDATGNLVARIRYAPYGEIDQVGSTGVDTVTHKFTGQEYDPEAQLYNYGARFYDPGLGVFTTADTVVPSAYASQAYNRYMYVAGNPVNYTDPTGHSWFSRAWSGITSAARDFALNWTTMGAYSYYRAYQDGGWKGLGAYALTGAINAALAVAGGDWAYSVSIVYTRDGGWSYGIGIGHRGVGISINYSNQGGWSAGATYGVALGQTTSPWSVRPTVGVNWSEHGGTDWSVSFSNAQAELLSPSTLTRGLFDQPTAAPGSRKAAPGSGEMGWEDFQQDFYALETDSPRSYVFGWDKAVTYFAYVEPGTGMDDLVVHGAANSFGIDYDDYGPLPVVGGTLAEMLNARRAAQGLGPQTRPIRLLSCRAGAGWAARDLANGLGVPVWAANTAVDGNLTWVMRGGVPTYLLVPRAEGWHWVMPQRSR